MLFFLYFASAVAWLGASAVNFYSGNLEMGGIGLILALQFGRLADRAHTSSPQGDGE